MYGDVERKAECLFLFVSGFSVLVNPPFFDLRHGETIELYCNHNSPDQSATFSWERLDGTPLPVERLGAGGRNGQILRISSLQEADSGVYVCKVSTSAGEQTGRGRIVVGK